MPTGFFNRGGRGGGKMESWKHEAEECLPSADGRTVSSGVPAGGEAPAGTVGSGPGARQPRRGHLTVGEQIGGTLWAWIRV